MNLEDFIRKYKSKQVKSIEVTERQIERAFEVLGKKTEVERNFHRILKL